MAKYYCFDVVSDRVSKLNYNSFVIKATILKESFWNIEKLHVYRTDWVWRFADTGKRVNTKLQEILDDFYHVYLANKKLWGFDDEEKTKASS